MEQAQPNIRRKIIVDLTEFGREGQIVLVKPDFYHQVAVQNTTVSTILTKEEIAQLRNIPDLAKRQAFIEERMTCNVMTAQALAVLSHIVEAPFHLNDVKRYQQLDVESFMDYMDMPLFERLKQAVDELDMDSPLPVSDITPQS